MRQYILLIVLCILPINASVIGQGGESIERKIPSLINDRFFWEVSLGGNLAAGIIMVPGKGLTRSNYLTAPSAGFQLGFYPVYKINHRWTARSGVLMSSRSFAYDLKTGAGTYNLKENGKSLGIPFYAQYRFGGSGLWWQVYSGFHFQYLVSHKLDYSFQSIPNYARQGSVSLLFDRTRFLPEWHVGIGLRYQVHKYYIGTDLLYFFGLRNQNRYADPRTVAIYEGYNPPFSYHAPGFRTHGFMVNLLIQKREKR